MIKRPLTAIGFGLWLLLIPALLLVRPLLTDAAPRPAKLGSAPEFTLTDTQGRPFASGQLSGEIVVIDFIFTRCTSICPVLTSKMVSLQADLPASLNGTPVTLVSVSVDPEFDRPEVLRAYAQRYQADPERWHMLTGSVEQIDAVVAGFQQVVERPEAAPGEVPDIRHSSRMVLIDPTGTVRGLYETDEDGMAALRQDVRVLGGGALARR